jgi:hypothetical protein
LRRDQLRVGPLFAARNPVREMQPRRILAGHDTGARGGTNRTGRIGVGETRALFGEAIQIDRLASRVSAKSALLTVYKWHANVLIDEL